MTVPAPRYDSIGHALHHLLRCAAVGLIHRDPDGTVMVSGFPGNDLQVWGASYLDVNGWLLSWDEPDGGRGYCLSVPGTAVLDRWDTTLWGPPTQPVASSRPLTPPCLDDCGLHGAERQRARGDRQWTDTEARRLITEALDRGSSSSEETP